MSNYYEDTVYRIPFEDITDPEQINEVAKQIRNLVDASDVVDQDHLELGLENTPEWVVDMLEEYTYQEVLAYLAEEGEEGLAYAYLLNDQSILSSGEDELSQIDPSGGLYEAVQARRQSIKEEKKIEKARRIVADYRSRYELMKGRRSQGQEYNVASFSLDELRRKVVLINGVKRFNSFLEAIEYDELKFHSEETISRTLQLVQSISKVFDDFPALLPEFIAGLERGLNTSESKRYVYRKVAHNALVALYTLRDGRNAEVELRELIDQQRSVGDDPVGEAKRMYREDVKLSVEERKRDAA